MSVFVLKSTDGATWSTARALNVKEGSSNPQKTNNLSNPLMKPRRRSLKRNQSCRPIPFVAAAENDLNKKKTPEQEDGASEDSHSLLQRHADIISGDVRSQQAAKEHPHVLDHWCDVPEQSVKLLSTIDEAHERNMAPISLELDKYIAPANCFAHFDCSDICKVHRCLSNLWLPPFLTWHDVDEWHPSTDVASQELEGHSWEAYVPLEFAFYTDGGSKYDEEKEARKGASAVILIVTTAMGKHFGGIQARTVEHPATAPFTEAWALLQAILWTVSILNVHPNAATATFTFFGDSVGPGAFSMGRWYPNVHTHIHDLCRNLVFWIEERIGRNCQWEHVKAHSGHPWNEAADTVASRVLQGRLQAPTCHDLWEEIHGFAANSSAFGWLWFIERQLRQPDPQIMLTDHDVVFKLPPKCDPLAFGDLDINRHWGRSSSVNAAPKEVMVRFASMNVLSLFPGKDSQCHGGGYPSARMEELALQCLQEHIDIVGIQESRHRGEQYFTISDYHVLPGAATSTGHGGVQIWIAKKWTGGLEISYEHIRILYSSPRLVLVSIKTPLIQIGVASLHCPNSVGDADLNEWWKEVDREFSRFGDLPTFVLIDSTLWLENL